MKPEPGLAHRALWPVVDGLRALGHDTDAILRHANLTVDFDDPDRRIPHAAAVALWDRAVAVTGDPDIGMHVAERASLASFDIHAYLMRASTTIEEAYRRMCRYQRLIHDVNVVDLSIRGDSAKLKHCLPGGRTAPRQTAEFLLTAWVRIGRELTGIAWTPLEARFAHPAPEVTAEHARVFGSAVRFRCGENALVFPAGLLGLPCREADPGLAAVLTRQADATLKTLPEVTTWSGRLRAALAEELDGGNPSIANVAAKLATSPRTLQRGLANEGTTFGEVLEALRFELAKNYLADARLPVARIAFLLGYSEAASFHRMFRRFSGRTPASFRRSG